MSQDQYNWVYKRLVQGPNDTVGALAYVLYKEQKIAFIEETLAKEGREPNDAELKAFHRTSLLEETVKGYLERAETLAEEFLEAGLAAKLQQAEDLVRQTVTSQEIQAAKTDIAAAVNATKQQLETQLNLVASDSKSAAQTATQELKPKIDIVLAELTGKKGFKGWFRDVSANLTVNFLTIFIIGILLTGYKGIGSFNSKAEEKSGVAEATAEKPNSTPAPAPTALKPEASKSS